MGANIDYKLKLYQLRSSLKGKGISRPITEMISRDMINKTTKNWDYLNGRIISQSFLDQLEKLDNIIE